jgi:hypothetical protein
MLNAAMHRRPLLALALAACGAETLDIDLEIEAPECEASDFAEVAVIEIAVYGEHAGTFCALARRCVYARDLYGPLADIDDFNDALRRAQQPLVAGLTEGAEHIRVNGRALDCWDLEPNLPNHPMCGNNEFAEARDGVVPIAMTCDESRCPREQYEQCP